MTQTFVDLGDMPLANAFLVSPADVEKEQTYPLHTYVCRECLLVQIGETVPPDVLFKDYAYFSSYSDMWLDHARRFADWATASVGLTEASLVVEVASNDGYLLRNFLEKGVRVLGIEPAENVAAVARDAGVPTDVRFFSEKVAHDLAGQGMIADLLVCNNVLAHVPDLNDFIAGLKVLLAPEGIISAEFPHLLTLLKETQFDTIYHEHVCYFSLLAIETVFTRHDLRILDVAELPTHGGSLRVLVTHSSDTRPEGNGLKEVRAKERDALLHSLETYDGFSSRVEGCRRALRAFLQDARMSGREVVAYGAAAKGNTLLNYCGVTDADIAYAVDRSPHKQGHLMPGSHLQIFPPSRVAETRPGFLLILPWNLKDEIMVQMSHIRDWGASFAIPIPSVTIV